MDNEDWIKTCEDALFKDMEEKMDLAKTEEEARKITNNFLQSWIDIDILTRLIKAHERLNEKD